MSYNKYKFAYFGSPRFAEIILKDITNAKIIPSVLVCNQDKPVGRKQIVAPPRTKQFVIESKLGMHIIQAKSKNDLLSYKDYFKNNNIDFAIVAAYSYIIPNKVIDAFKLGMIAVHPSLLPKYRGSSPIQSVIIDGKKETGSTLFILDDQPDHGQIILQKKLEEDISNIYYLELEEKLAHLSANMIIDVLKDLTKQIDNAVIQNHNIATYTNKFRTEDGYIKLGSDNPKEIARKIRALGINPGVYTFIDGIRTKLVEFKEKDNKIIITKIIPSGKKERNVNIQL